MRTVNIKVALIGLGACVFAVGCSPLAPQPDPSKFFILTPLSDASGPAPAPALAKADSPLTIGVGPIDFPDYLRRLQVVTRESPNQLDLSAEKRWGEPLDKNFARVFSEDIAILLNTQQIEKYPWPVRTRVDYQIEIDVQRFETTSDGQSELVARWAIKDGVTGKDLYASKTTANAPVGPGETGASAALSSDLATLSREVAAQVTVLRRHQTAVSTAENLVLNRHPL
jgi:uncharacterized lipoprotein YmbA